MSDQLTANEKALKTWCLARLKEVREDLKQDPDDLHSQGQRDAFEEFLDWWFK